MQKKSQSKKWVREKQIHRRYRTFMVLFHSLKTKSDIENVITYTSYLIVEYLISAMYLQQKTLYGAHLLTLQLILIEAHLDTLHV